MNNELEWEKVLEWTQNEVSLDSCRPPISFILSPINSKSPLKFRISIPEISGSLSSPVQVLKN